tara:strand:+ start:199 stop:387 length:189 start_codon:yes stop_codon:yes gene_type:complete
MSHASQPSHAEAQPHLTDHSCELLLHQPPHASLAPSLASLAITKGAAQASMAMSRKAIATNW